MKRWSWLLPVLAWVLPMLPVGFISYQIGHTNGRLFEREENRDECACGQTRTCAFGPGIVGEQKCDDNTWKNTWTRCEPRKEGK